MSRARDLADGTFSGAVAAASGDFTGTIEAADFSDGTLTVGTEYVTNGSAKAWVNFNGTGTVAIREGFNVASITDNGTGDYTANFTAALADANYCALGSASSSGSQSALTEFADRGFSASSVQIATRNFASNRIDSLDVFIGVHR